MPKHYRVFLSIHRHYVVAYPIGNLTKEAALFLCNKLDGLLRGQAPRAVFISLKRVSHIHFQAVETIVNLTAALRERSIPLVVTDASPYLRQILNFAGAFSLVGDEPSLTDALRHLDAGSADHEQRG